MNDTMIDLRSDTVTHPTDNMRKAMSTAEVGDDVYGEDPTINRLEERAAELLGREAAVYVPTGTMGNQIAIHLHTHPGSEVVAEAGSHIFNFEMGAMAALSGALPRAIATDDGILSPEQVRSAIQPRAGYRTPTALLVLENSHNLAGGRITPLARMAELIAVAREHDLPVHLDGARIHNSAAALGISAAELSAGCETVMFCLSKGLGAPVGSILAGSEETIAEARRIRKMFGGGMRQAGIIAAAGLVALDEVMPLLAEDNRRAHELALGLAAIPAIVLDPDTVETNIVFFSLTEDAAVGAGTLARKLAEHGVLCHPLGGDSIRMVTHYHIGDEDIERAVEVTKKVLGANGELGIRN
jgi:threonine aldolase